MSRLQLSIQKFLEGESSFAVGELLDQDARTVQTLEIPIGSHVSPLELNVEPGPYLIRAVLPSGQRLSQQVKVLKQEEPTVAVLDAHGSAHEWLSWHHLAMGVAEATLAVDSARYFRAPRDAISGVTLGVELTLFTSNDARSVGRDVSIDGDNTLLLDTFRCQISTYTDGPMLLVRFVSESNWEPYSIRFPRIFLRARIGNLSQIVAVPIPWRSNTPIQRDGNFNVFDRIVEVLLTHPAAKIPSPRRTPLGSPRIITSTLVRDPRFGSALPFLAAGDVDYAHRTLGNVRAIAERMLYDKRANPLAAAAGGYVLARSAEEVTADWIDWSGNLTKWFPWLPDGAILHGWFLLDALGDVKEAQRSFAEALSRGIPVFTEGVRLLSEGLMRTAPLNLRSKNIEELLGRVRSYALAADPRQVFTTLYGETPEQPSPPPECVSFER